MRRVSTVIVWAGLALWMVSCVVVSALPPYQQADVPIEIAQAIASAKELSTKY